MPHSIKQHCLCYHPCASSLFGPSYMLNYTRSTGYLVAQYLIQCLATIRIKLVSCRAILSISTGSRKRIEEDYWVLGGGVHRRRAHFTCGDNGILNITTAFHAYIKGAFIANSIHTKSTFLSFVYHAFHCCWSYCCCLCFHCPCSQGLFG